MIKKRIIARIDIKNEFVIKGIHLEGLRKVGNPNELAKKYYENGIDEIFFMDAVASYYDRNSLSHIIEKSCHDVFIPITVGGGLRTIKDIQQALKSGADKVAINTQAVRNPNFIKEASRIFGSQCIVSSLVVKHVRKPGIEWEIYTDNGREPTGINAIDWAKKVEQLGAGEIVITSIDMEGTKRGFDYDVTRRIAECVRIPIIASGGCGNINHIRQLFGDDNIDAVSIASILHYNIDSIENIKNQLNAEGIRVKVDG